MITSRDVFLIRKEGKLDEAYNMAIELINKADNDEWNIKAFAWCLIDLIKRDSKSGNIEHTLQYSEQLRNLTIDISDKILTEQREYALKLCSINGQEILKAKLLSKQGDHIGALKIYKRIYDNGDQSTDIRNALGWSQYHVAKEMLETKTVNYDVVKRLLHDYLKLNTEKPSLLHSCILQLADKIAKEGKLNMGIFCRIWGLENFRPEDYESYVSDNGNSFLSLAERIIQKAAKDSLKHNLSNELMYLVPYISDYIKRYPDNIWLKHSKAKVLIAINKSNEALIYGIEVVKNKINDYWAWELLGDIYQSKSNELAISCYCKALLCSKDLNFVGKVKSKLAELLSKTGQTSAAKLELDQYYKHRLENNQKIPELINTLMHSSWYQSTVSNISNHQFYLEHAIFAEELLYNNLPWIKAVLGDIFFIEGKKGKAKRKLYLATNTLPLEVTISETKLNLDNRIPGTALRIKGEIDREKRFQVYVVQERISDEDWDIFEQQIGIVDHINTSKKLLHFIVSQTIDGVIPFSELIESFNEGDGISLRLAKYTNKKITRYKALASSKTTAPIPSNLLKDFHDEVREGNGMGFTEDGIFIPPSLMKKHSINDGDYVFGQAIINFNKKRLEWGWRAIRIIEVENDTDAH